MALREFPESHDSRTPGRTAWPARLAWIPIPAFVAAIAILYAQDSPESNDSRYLMLALNLVFSALICLFVTYLVARSFLVRPTPGLLMFGCGVLLWGLAGVVGIVAGLIGRSDEAFFINALITIHNCTVLLSGVCQLAGAALLLRPTRSLAAPGLWLAAGYTAVVGAVGLLTVATAAGWLPPFFVQGQGGTPLRQFILGSAVLLFAVTAALLVLSRRRSGSGFTRWYAMALALVSVGLFGILLERVHGGALSWTGRSAQFLSGVYMLAAAICAVRESRVWGIPLEAALRKSEQRYQELFNSMSEGFALHEIITNEAGTPVDYRFLDINPAFERLTGLRRENVVGRRVLEVLPDNDPYWVEAYGKVALTGEPARLENFATPLDRWYEAFAYRPAPRQFAVVFTDITERKRAEQEVQRLLSAVQEEKERLSCLLNSIGDEVWFADTHRQFTLANPAAAREFRLGPTDGIDVEKLAANLEVYRADGSPRPVEEAPPLRALAGEVIRGEEEIIRTPGAGELRHRQVSAAPVRDSGGRIIGSVAVVRDITDHKRAEEALRRSQKTFFELVERSPFGIYIVDSRFCVAQMNANAQNGAFRNVRPVIGRDFNEAMRILWPENVAAGILAAFRHTLESGEAYYSSRFVNPRHDVEIVEAYEWELHRITLPDGQYGVICYYYDSTELRQTEAALREGEERLRLVLQASSTGTFEVDLTTGEGRWNATEYELLGLKPGDVLPGPEIFFRYVHPDDVGLLRARWEEALRIGALDAEFRIVRADGEVRWLAGKGEFVYEATRGHDGREDRGKALRFMGVNFDIHARKQAEEALRDSERRQREKAAELAALLEAVPTPVFIAQDPDCLHLSGNRAADELLRIPRGAEASLSASEDIKPRHFKALKDGRELRLDELPAQRAARGEHVRDFEFSLAFDDGVVRHVLGYGTPLVDEQGRPRGAVHVLVDITERKRAEEALRQARDELEHRVLERTAELHARAGQLSQLASELTLAEARERRRLATILHDHLQQLLVGAKFSTSILRMKAGKDVQPTVEQLAETLTEAIRAARSLTADLSPPILHEKGLAAGLEWLGRQMHGKHGMAIEVDAQADGEPQAEQVRIFLFEAVRELLLNAAKHAQTDTARVGLRLLDSGEVEVTVADSGAGFDPARLENEMTATGGFGLFSIRERLGYLGGRMTVDSAPGRGSRFTLVAPARLASAPVEAPPKAAETPQAAQATGPAAGPLPDARGRIRVLLADDHPIVRQGLARLLQEQPDIQVVGEAADGQEAVDLVRQLRPDVVLMDVTMPRVNGFAATRQIVSEFPAIRIIGLSMHEEADMAAAMRKAGAVAYLAKGGPTDALIAAIRAARARD